ncbi:hypothetical protein [Paraurantiacibacter namhicola]|uniref:Uncharacterized protein n=1 Tax=Paraurantiacibacter namhicola TaxID=645517 RepID=A0A1C7DB31_9SPHN|nr:hypothetical protein [Paraurantiacibacter namhicola]ANU08710.1 hypothetical protein A6F65_02429 [Paraurantiacibacter namhicola]
MKSLEVFAIALTCGGLSIPFAASAQSFPSMPRVSELPRIPETVGGVLERADPSARNEGVNASSGDLTDQYMADVMIVAQGTSFAGNSEADDRRLDKEIEMYRAAVDRLASGRYASVPKQVRDSMELQMMRYFDQRTQRVDADINFIKGRVAENAGYDERIGTRVYNGLISLDAEMYAANTLFPGRAGYAEAQAKVAKLVADFGSRGGEANAALGELGAEQAAKVKMPPATTRDPALEAMFRRAFKSGGMGGEILLINPRGGWTVKRNSLGRVIGETHDAAIAATNPKIEGVCNLYEFTMLKETNGQVTRDSHTTRRIACENVK